MGNFIFGTVFGIVIATIGFSGIAKIADNSIGLIKQLSVQSVNQGS